MRLAAASSQTSNQQNSFFKQLLWSTSRHILYMSASLSIKETDLDLHFTADRTFMMRRRARIPEVIHDCLQVGRRSSMSPGRLDAEVPESSKALQKEVKAERDRADGLARCSLLLTMILGVELRGYDKRAVGKPLKRN